MNKILLNNALDSNKYFPLAKTFPTDLKLLTERDIEGKANLTYRFKERISNF